MLCSTWSSYTAAQQAYALSFATQVIWAATGRRFGLCAVTIRPCIGRSEGLYQTFPVAGHWSVYGVTGGITVQYGSCDCCERSACSAAALPLPGPVASITTVTIDGVVVDPSTYRLDGHLLVRQDGAGWPVTQDLSAAEGSADTFSIAYQRGEAVPTILNDVAGRYACEVAKGMVGGSCALPNRIQSLTRNGIDLTMMDPGDYLSQGRTGFAEIDQMITAYNPDGLRSRPRVLSPDLPTYR